METSAPWDLWQALNEAIKQVSRDTIDIYYFAEQEWLAQTPETQAEFFDDCCVWIEEIGAYKATIIRAMRYLAENL